MKAKKIFEEIKSSKVFYSLVGLIVLIILSGNYSTELQNSR